MAEVSELIERGVTETNKITGSVYFVKNTLYFIRVLFSDYFLEGRLSLSQCLLDWTVQIDH